MGVIMFSNCFFEAVKAKLKDWNNTKVYIIPRKYNQDFFHFVWEKDNKIFHYESLNKDKFKLFFEGIIKIQSKKTFESFILRNKMCFATCEEIIKVAKKFNFDSINEPGWLDWETYSPEFELNNVPVKNKICKMIMVQKDLEIKIMNIENFEKNTSSGICWKYLSPYCSEWKLFSPKIR